MMTVRRPPSRVDALRRWDGRGIREMGGMSIRFRGSDTRVRTLRERGASEKGDEHGHTTKTKSYSIK